jgi:hypothetical protein
MHDAAVALTDYALTVENALLALMLWRARRTIALSQAAASTRLSSRSISVFWFVLFFAAIALSSVLGATFHGFIADENTLLGRAMWRAVMIAIGLVALTGANAAGAMWSEKMKRLVWIIAAVAFVAYCLVVIFVSQDFRNAILIYLPATVFLLVSFIAMYVRSRDGGALVGAAGLVLTFVAAAIQQSTLGMAALHLDHNALYHIVQAVALVLVYVGARACCARLARTNPVR